MSFFGGPVAAGEWLKAKRRFSPVAAESARLSTPPRRRRGSGGRAIAEALSALLSETGNLAMLGTPVPRTAGLW